MQKTFVLLYFENYTSVGETEAQILIGNQNI